MYKAAHAGVRNIVNAQRELRLVHNSEEINHNNDNIVLFSDLMRISSNCGTRTISYFFELYYFLIFLEL